MSDTVRTTSEDETRKFARNFAAGLRQGDVVALYGELGAGKTQFVKGVCDGLGVSETVASPTFVLLNRYEGTSAQGPTLVYHFDLYRVQSAEEIYDLGYEEFLFGEGICLVEWADRLEQLLPAKRFDVSMSLGERESERIITIDAKRTHIPGGKKDVERQR